jgi:hypothetical protein
MLFFSEVKQAASTARAIEVASAIISESGTESLPE